ncbi:hypothetical protein [Xanthomonas cerealis]|nr:hypothetical protein [Xanthomonas translucens]
MDLASPPHRKDVRNAHLPSPPVLPALWTLLLGSAPPASADMFGSPEAVARSWVGHDASELMMQWPVDHGLYT